MVWREENTLFPPTDHPIGFTQWFDLKRIFLGHRTVEGNADLGHSSPHPPCLTPSPLALFAEARVVRATLPLYY